MLLEFSKQQIKSIQQSNARINLWEGSVRSGKTFASLIRFIKYIEEAPPGPLLIAGKTEDSLRKNILYELSNLLGSYMKYSYGKREITIGNRIIHVVGANDDRAEGKIRGWTIAGAYIDELTILPESFFSMVLSRMSVTGAKLFCTTNPDSPFHWFKVNYIDRLEDLDLKRFKFNLDDNPALDATYKKNISMEYTGLYYKRFILGEWVLAEGTIFDFFNPNLHCIDMPPAPAIHHFVGIDYGTVNPCAFVMIGYNPNTFPNMWLEKEYYWSSREQNRQKTDSEYADDLKKFIQGYNVRGIYLDPAAASFKIECQRSGIPNVFDAKNDVLDGIRFHSQLLYNGTFKICSGCKKSIQEYETYQWDPKSKNLGIDKPLKENDHALDAIRYALYTQFYNKSQSSLTPEDLYKFEMEAMGEQTNIFFNSNTQYSPYR